MARVPKVARETISRGTPSLRNLPRNSGWILNFQKIAIKFRRQWSCTKFQISPLKIILQNSFKTLQELLPWVFTENWRYRQLTGSPIYCYANSRLSLKVSWSRDSMQMERTFSCAWRQRRQYLNNISGWKTVIPRIVRISLCSGPKMVKSTIVQYVFRTLTLTVCFVIVMSGKARSENPL